MTKWIMTIVFFMAASVHAGEKNKEDCMHNKPEKRITTKTAAKQKQTPLNKKDEGKKHIK